jgi:hypothetical protein
MNAKITAIAAGIALLAGVGIANAEERLTAASMDNVTAAGGYDSLHVWKNVYTNVYVSGNLAHASAGATCYGGDCLAQTATSTNTTPWSGSASSTSVSATD